MRHLEARMIGPAKTIVTGKVIAFWHANGEHREPTHYPLRNIGILFVGDSVCNF